MKKFVSVLTALVCVLGLSVASFAFTNKKPTDYSIVTDAGDNYAFNFEVKASTFTSEQLTVWKDCMSAMTGASSKIFVMTYNFSQNTISVTAVVPARYGFAISSNTGALYLQNADFSDPAVPYLVIDTLTGKCRELKTFTRSTSLFLDDVNTVIMLGFADLLENKGTSIYPPTNTKCVEWDKRVALADDLNKPVEPEVPEEPSEPGESVPDTPKPPSYTPAEPTIPEGNEYVLYDTGIWYTVIDHIKKNMGSAANIGLLVFGFILIWTILRKIFHHFTRV